MDRREKYLAEFRRAIPLLESNAKSLEATSDSLITMGGNALQHRLGGFASAASMVSAHMQGAADACRRASEACMMAEGLQRIVDEEMAKDAKAGAARHN